MQNASALTLEMHSSFINQPLAPKNKIHHD